MTTGVIIQARTGSTRLPGKVLMNLKDKTVLCHVIERVSQARQVDKIVIATTVNQADDAIEKEAQKCGVSVYRGSEDDVLSRYYEAAVKYEMDIVVRITADCPLIDPHVIDRLIMIYEDNDYDYVSNGGSDLSLRKYPRGLDVEVFSFDSLEKADSGAKEPYQREHVTPYIYENANSIFYDSDREDYSHYRWTLDTKEDYTLISRIYEELYQGSHDFYFEDIIKLMEDEPELSLINENIKQKELKDK